MLEKRQAFGRSWAVPKQDYWGWQHPLQCWDNFFRLIQLYVPAERRHLCVQAGGCFGLYPQLLRQCFSRVLTFEPDDLNFTAIEANTTGVEAYKMALGDKARQVGIHRPFDANCGNHHVVQWAEDMQSASPLEGTIEMRSLDSFELPALDALLLDAEASEPLIITGARETITRCRPALITAETVTSGMSDELRGLGYTLQPKIAEDWHFLCSRYS